MQATKQQSSSGKKCKNTNTNKFHHEHKMAAPGTSMAENHDDTINNNNNNKSIAQRVMDVTSNNNINQGKASQGSSNNSVDNDQEVEDITNRASRLEVGATNSNSNEKNDQHQLHNNHHHHHHHHQLIEVAGETTLSTSNTTTTNTTTTTAPAPTTTTTSSSSTSLSSSAAVNKQPMASDSPKLLLDEMPLATPDSVNNNTQMPTLNKAGSRQTFSNHSSSIPSLSDGLPATCESVVFRQQQQQQQMMVNKSGSLNQSAGGGGLIMESNRPKIDNPMDHRQQSLEKCISLDTKVPHPLDSQVDFRLIAQDEPATSCQHLQQQQQQQHQLLEQQHLHQLQQQLQHPHPHPAGEHHRFTSQHSRQSSSRDYLNDVDDDDDGDYDECDPRYHNASVEKRTQKQFQDEQNNEANDYNNTNDRHEPGNYQSRINTGASSTPTSPKAKSAPATPCNVTPIAFHQHSSHLNATQAPSSANTLPLDIRKNISATLNPIDLQYLDELLKRGEQAFKGKNYPNAIRSFSQCIELAKNNLPENSNLAYLKKNFKVYGHRAEAYLMLGHFNEAIEDSMAARDLNPKWTKAYRLQGQSQFRLGQYADSLAAFSFGLAQDPSNGELFDVLVQSALQSSFKQHFEPEYKKLKSLELDKKPFVVVSVLGQELLSKGHGKHAAIILESALKMNLDSNNNKKFKASVLSTIAVAYCLIKDYDRAISYMLKELEIEKELEDVNGQCRVLSNLGYTYYKLRKFDNSLDVHRKQLNIAMKTKLFHQASMALNAIGHVHSARQDYSNALTSHTRCLELLRQLGDDDYSQFKELLSIGHIHSMLNDFKASEEMYNEATMLLRQCQCKISPDDFYVGSIMVKFNLAYLSLKRQAYHEATSFYNEILDLSQKISQPRWTSLYDMRASNGLGQTYRLCRDFQEARKWFSRQLQLARQLDDVSGQSQALCNLGMTCQYFKDYNKAWNYFEENLRLVDKQGGGDKLLMAYALSYMGSIYFMKGRIGEAQSNYENSFNLFKELNYCSAERKTIELNMGFVQERAGHPSELNASSSFNHHSHQRKVMLAP